MSQSSQRSIYHSWMIFRDVPPNDQEQEEDSNQHLSEELKELKSQQVHGKSTTGEPSRSSVLFVEEVHHENEERPFGKNQLTPNTNPPTSTISASDTQPTTEHTGKNEYQSSVPIKSAMSSTSSSKSVLTSSELHEGEKKPTIPVDESSLSYWNRSSFYSTLGIYYDSLPSFPTVSQPSSLFEEGSHLSSLISSLSSEEEWEESVYSFSDDW